MLKVALIASLMIGVVMFKALELFASMCGI